MPNEFNEGDLARWEKQVDHFLTLESGSELHMAITAREMQSLLARLKSLWKIARAGQEHCRTHGHAADNALEDALIEAGLLDPALAGWRRKPAAKKS